MLYKSMGELSPLIGYIIKNNIKIDANALDYYIGTIGNDNVEYLITYNNQPLYHGKKKACSIYNNTNLPVGLERTEQGFISLYEGQNINLSKVDNRAVIELLVKTINKELQRRPNINQDLLIGEIIGMSK